MELLTVVDEHKRIFRWRSLTLDLDQRCLRVGEHIVPVSRAEFGVLHLLLSRRNLPLTKEFIMSQLFGAGHGRDLRQADMFVARLRRSLAPFDLAGLISCIDGRGYAVMDEHGDAVPAAGAPTRRWAAFSDDDAGHGWWVDPTGSLGHGEGVQNLPMRESVGA